MLPLVHHNKQESQNAMFKNAKQFSQYEYALKCNLAAAYRLFAYFKMDDLTYTHLSARLPSTDFYFIYPFGYLFEEVTASSLLKVDLDGNILEGTEEQYNQTGYIIHGSIYRKRPDVNAIFHLHTTAGVAVSVMKCGLLPLSQFSFHFHNRLSYHDYNSLALDDKQHGIKLQEDLGDNKALILRNHGTLTCGRTVSEAFFRAYYLEQACKVQCQALQTGQELVFPPEAICEQAAKDMRNFETDLGQRDWKALLRKLSKDPTYKDWIL
jgi:ribulose-5-phosphate 4-epimerase/fuculose-1-phosphate aldolase